MMTDRTDSTNPRQCNPASCMTSRAMADRSSRSPPWPTMREIGRAPRWRTAWYAEPSAAAMRAGYPCGQARPRSLRAHTHRVPPDPHRSCKPGSRTGSISGCPDTGACRFPALAISAIASDSDSIDRSNQELPLSLTILASFGVSEMMKCLLFRWITKAAPPRERNSRHPRDTAKLARGGDVGAGRTPALRRDADRPPNGRRRAAPTILC